LGNKSIFFLLKNFWNHINGRRKFQIFCLILLIILVSLVEVISLGAVIPFLGALTAPEKILESQLLLPIFNQFNIQNSHDLRFAMTVLFITAVIFSGLVRLVLVWSQTRLSYAIGADISIACYRHIIHLPYLTLISKNSSEFITGIVNKTGMVVTQVILPALLIFSTSILLLAIIITLLFIDTLVALSTLFGFAFIYGIVFYLNKKKLISNALKVSHKHNALIQSLQEGLGGIRDVIIDGNQETYCEIFREVDLPLRKAEAGISIIGQTPRFIVEALGITILTSLAYYLSLRPDGINAAIPILGVFALAAQRLLPILQQIYQSWTSILGCSEILKDILYFLNQSIPDYYKLPKPKPINFLKNITLKNLHFKYTDNGEEIIKDLSCTIKKGDRVGIIGKTGSGKSTLIDIIMGLLVPQRGKILIDNKIIHPRSYRSWQLHIAHVPQNIFLTDSSIIENIALGVPKKEIDYELAYRCAESAQIEDTINSWPNKYDTIVGERGIRLSGGQKQRIGIARALYKKSNLIIFDEATSALDDYTEAKVIDSIFNIDPNITLILISHRLTTLKYCSLIIEVDDGKINRSGSYDEIIKKKR
jgi:ABC-type multidrug transport system fused ATPase/permease subunit